MLFHEAVMWKRLIHPNIVPFYGVSLDPPQLVSDWMVSGDLTEFITERPNANRLGLVRAPLMSEVLSRILISSLAQ